MSGYFLKRKHGDLVLKAPFEAPILKPGEQIVSDLGWICQPSVSRDLALSVKGRDHDPASVTALVRGGCPGEIHMVTAQVRTSFDRTLRRSFVVRITD